MFLLKVVYILHCKDMVCSNIAFKNLNHVWSLTVMSCGVSTAEFLQKWCVFFFFSFPYMYVGSVCHFLLTLWVVWCWHIVQLLCDWRFCLALHNKSHVIISFWLNFSSMQKDNIIFIYCFKCLPTTIWILINLLNS